MRHLFRFFIISGLFAGTLASCNNNSDSPDHDESIVHPPSGIAAPKTISYTIIGQYPHDTASFTEGLEFFNGKLYESGGDYNNSVLQFGDVKTGIIEKKNKMGTDSIFGEGITILNNKIYQLTYQTNIVYVYDVKDISKPIKTLRWPMEGWGMTNNGTDLIITTGGANLYFVDPETFKVKNTVAVVSNSGPVEAVNELEYVDGFVWANVWQTNRIIKIDPESGHVVGEMMLENLLQSSDYVHGKTDVLNGIAYDSTSKTMFFTGKRWPKIFQVRIN